MLSLPDFTEKKILFVFPQKDLESQLKFGNSNLRLYRDDKIENEISLHLLIGIFMIGEFTITSYLIRQLKEHGISLFMVNNSFKYYGSINAEAEGNTEIRSIQYAMDQSKQLQFAKILVANKVANQFGLIKDYLGHSPTIHIDKVLPNIADASMNQSLLGIEGSVANKYFKQVFKDYGWLRRAPTTKEDINNLLLDIGYSFLFNFVDSLLRLFGFDTYKGFYHKLYFQRKSLSCDLMEPIRVIIDKALLKAYALNRIDEKDFKYKQGQFEFKDWEVQKKYLGIFSSAIMHHKDDIYAYVLDWYRYYHNQEKYSPPEFKVRL
jgi:CRISPR-associated protein Cas1